MSLMLQEITDPPAEWAGRDVADFLAKLKAPTLFRFKGRSAGPTRVAVTLLHGNEPSGTHAVRRWILGQYRPLNDLWIIVASVNTALAAPLFSHRMLPDCRDLNRCFRPPFDDEQGQLAHAILEVIERAEPEAVIDLHNTSGSGPAFGVCPHWDIQHEALISLFAPRMVISELAIGALMEISDRATPTVTIELGGREDAAAHELAWEGLQRFALEPRILALPGETDWGMEVFRDSVRIELQPGTPLRFADQPGEPGITLRTDIERFNFGRVNRNTPLGGCQSPLASVLKAENARGDDVLETLLCVREGQIYPARTLRLFMVTTHQRIAREDCLFYAVCDEALETAIDG